MGLLNWLFGTKSKNNGHSAQPINNKRQLSTTEHDDWKTSAAHLLLLSKFLHGSSVEHFDHTDYWVPVLKEQPAQAIKRFIDEQILEPLDIDTCIHLKFNIPDLKVLLKERGLKVSGNKTILVNRLLENDRLGMEKVIAQSGMYKCSQAGASIAQAYLTSQNDEKNKTESEVLRLLTERRFKEALRTVAIHESAQVFSRGIGMNWDHYGSKEDVLELSAIFEKKPKILEVITEDRLNPLRLAAGMLHLLGTNRIDPWLSPDYETGIRFNAETSVAMLLAHARHHRHMSDFKDIGGFVKEVEFWSIDNDDACPACKKLNGRKYKIDKFPELPYPKCTSSRGCRCTERAVFKHE